MTGNDADDPKQTGKDFVSHHTDEESQDSTNPKPIVQFGGAYQPADLDHYSKFPVWTHLELACLSLGYDPQPLLKADIKALQALPSQFNSLERRLHLIQRACDAETLGNPTPPVLGLNWLNSVDVDLPEDFIAKCERYSSELVPVPFEEVKSWFGDIAVRMENVEQKLQSDNLGLDAAGTRQRVDSLQRIVLGMACDKYDFDPSRLRNPTARMIAGATQLIGVDVDEGTIRSHLAAAMKKHWQD